jgi:hypothetical protein
VLINSVLPTTSSVALTLDIWSDNVKEDYISVVCHYVNADWELQKRVIGLRLIELRNTGENIAKRIDVVVEEFCLVDKIFFVILDNASSNSKTMDTLTPLFVGYLGPDPSPESQDPNRGNYTLMHQRYACHIINLIVKSGMKRLKPFLEDFRTANNFLNAYNSRIATFKEYCKARGVRPRKFGLDMDVRWNSTYLMLKHLVPYKTVFLSSSIHIPPNWLHTPSHLVSSHVLTLFEIMFGCLYVWVTICMGGCKIRHFDAINMHPPICLKLSYMDGQGGASLRMDAQPSNQADYE